MESAIRLYQTDGIEPSGLDGAEMMAFLLIKKIIDRRRRQREARLRKKASAEAPTAPKPETGKTYETGEADETSKPTSFNEKTGPDMPQPATLTDNGDIYGHLRKLRRASRNLKRKKKRVQG